MAESDKPEEHPEPEHNGKRVDEAWKEEVRREKETADRTHEQTRRGALPEPSFSFLVTSLAMQTVMHFGDIPNPVSGEPNVDLEQAKHSIDTLGVLEQKTMGNLTDQESKLLQTTLYDLRLRYVAMSASGADRGTS